MPDIEDGESVEIQGSAKLPYVLRNVGGVYSCSCPAWRNQSVAIETRTCKHLRKYRGDAAEEARLGSLPTSSPSKPKAKPAPSPRGASAGSASAEESDAESAPSVLLAHSWDNSTDLTGWWMSEKLDGVRAYWDGKQFFSRQGNVFHAPDWFVEDLPSDIHLDGELWIARKAFQRTVSVVRRQDKSKDWEEVRFVVFDAPGLDDVFEARLAYLQQLLDESQPRFATPHAQERCRSHEHLKEELKKVEEKGGEGLMLRQPQSRYERCRSHTLLKVKSLHDAEARVLEHLPGAGRHKGRMGALAVELNDGTRFNIGTGFSDKERENPPPVGSIVTFRYQELTDRGVPRFPSFVRLRTDVDDLPERSLDGDTTRGVERTLAVTSASVQEEDAPINAAKQVEKVPVASTRSVETRSDNVLNFAPRGGASLMDAPRKTTSSRRYFEFVEGTSSKFWSIWRDDADVTVCYGKIGTDGQEKTKAFDDETAAENYYSKIVAEKLEKGYVEKLSAADLDEDEDSDFEVECDDDDLPFDGYDDSEEGEEEDSDGDETGYASEYSGTGMSTCYCSECWNTGSNGDDGDVSQSEKAKPQAAPAKKNVTCDLRYFEFVEGTSSKFWSITMSQNDVTVKYGRIGTAGQEKTKSFADSKSARKYYDEIIEEKLEKGYEEVEKDD